MWLWRKMLRIFWSDKVSNDELLKWRVEVEKSIKSITNKRQRVSDIISRRPDPA